VENLTNCPKCGSSLLEQTGDNPPAWRCAACGEMIGAAATELGDTVTMAAPLGEEPGALRVDHPAERRLQLPGFEILEELGRGGMGIVYRARQLSLNRDVAIKVLRPDMAEDVYLLERFRNEAEVAGGLTDAHILPVFDVLSVDGAPVIVMPLVEGSDLRRIIKDRYALRQGRSLAEPHPFAQLSDRDYLGRVLPLLDQLIDAVAAMHGAGVLHRDIKPSNVLVDQRGNVWLSDFGLSRLGERRLHTVQGEAIGTYGFMSPEQSAGELDIDARSDLFSLGVTLYQALTLELPFGAQGARPSDPLPAAPSRRQRMLSRDLDAVVLKALEPRPQDRYASAAELRDDWRLARAGLLPQARRLGPLGRLARRLRRNPAAVAAALLLCLVVGLLVAFWFRPAPPPPADRQVMITTEPPGARVVLVPIDEEPYDVTDGEPLPERAIRPADGQLTPLVIERVPPGTYLVVAQVPQHGFHEVYRTVPLRGESPAGPFAHQRWTVDSSDTVELPPIVIPKDSADDPVAKDMVRFKGGEFTMGHPPEANHPSTPHQRTVAAFDLDPTEVTIGQFQEVMGKLALPPQLRQFQVQRPDTHPVSFVTWAEAMAYAEKVGKRLPTEAEYEFAATLGGTRKFPWGDDAERIKDWTLGPVGQPAWDRTATEPPVYGLYSGVAEWTTSMLGPYSSSNVSLLPLHTMPPEARRVIEEMITTSRAGRVARGGPWSAIVGYPEPAEWQAGPRRREGVAKTDRHPGLGFRCARSDRPRWDE
jgi:formylglycine-generating enzyme required for sulfatase activity/tRNA A-37 threonylcarbamoyl transferase component Bud32